MNKQVIELTIAIIFCFAIPIAVIFYDRIRHRKYYNKKGTIIFLRRNNPDVRKQIKEAGIQLCPCARNFSNTFLYYTEEGCIVCGFNESRQHLISDADKNHINVIDCGTDVDKFIQEVKSYEDFSI